jgi:arabinose-5-phosphate isomerase
MIQLNDKTRVCYRIVQILRREAEAIASVKADDQFYEAVRLLASCQTKIVATGMGKAGHVARRFASVLSSLGMTSIFMHPAEAAHGDLGIVSSGDCLVTFSTSGKTRELLDIIPGARKLGVANIIAVTSHRDSPLRDLADVVLNMGAIDEPCCLGLTPTASTAVMGAIADSLALVAMETRGFSAEAYHSRHPAGYLGRQAAVKALAEASSADLYRGSL